MKKLVSSIFLLSIILLLVTFSIYFNTHKTIQKQVFEASVEIVPNNSASFDSNKSMFNFGRTGKGNTITKFLSVTNNYNFPIAVEVKKRGIISDLIKPENNIIIEEGESKSIGITLIAYNESSEGIYNGEIEFLIKKS